MLSRKFAVDGEQNIASPTDTVLTVTSGANIETSIYFFSIGPEDTAGDNTFVWYFQRFTAAGTGTAVTPQNLGPSTPAAVTVAAENHTVEPTYTANAILWRMGLNQRASHTIGLDPAGALTAPATANNGIGLYPVHASSTVLVGATLHFTE